jgi:integrase
MAVVTRKRKSGTTYFAVNVWQGRQVSERVGSSRRDAEVRDRAMKREIEAGTYRPPSETRALTIGQYAESWGSTRKNAYGSDERGVIRLHITGSEIAELRLDETTPMQVARWVQTLKRKPGRKGETMSDKTIANTLGVVYQVFESAIRSELVEKNPCSLERGKLDRTPENEREPYTIAEALVLMRHHAIPWPIRVLNGLCLLTGMRKGEAVARRWRDLDTSAGPLAALKIHDQYDGQPLKTKRPRVTPIHPELATMLQAWASEGFELWTGRKPTPDDLIVPTTRTARRGPSRGARLSRRSCAARSWPASDPARCTRRGTRSSRSAGAAARRRT